MEVSVVTEVQNEILRWFEHVERINERRFIKQIYKVSACESIVKV